MFEIDLEVSTRIREKRGRKNLNIQNAAEEIRISRKTLREIENGKKNRVNKAVFKKIMDWLLSEDT